MSRKLLLLSLAASAGIVVGVLQLETPTIYSFGVRDFLARDIRGREVRVSGRLVPGTLCKVTEASGYRFVLAEPYPLGDAGGATLAVHYEGGPLPDTFRDVPGYDLSVVTQGERCQTCHDFRASQIMAKCPGKYEYPSGVAVHRGAASPPRCDAAAPRR